MAPSSEAVQLVYGSDQFLLFVPVELSKKLVHCSGFGTEDSPTPFTYYTVLYFSYSYLVLMVHSKQLGGGRLLYRYI